MYQACTRHLPQIKRLSPARLLRCSSHMTFAPGRSPCLRSPHSPQVDRGRDPDLKSGYAMASLRLSQITSWHHVHAHAGYINAAESVTTEQGEHEVRSTRLHEVGSGDWQRPATPSSTKPVVLLAVIYSTAKSLESGLKISFLLPRGGRCVNLCSHRDLSSGSSIGINQTYCRATKVCGNERCMRKLVNIWQAIYLQNSLHDSRTSSYPSSPQYQASKRCD